MSKKEDKKPDMVWYEVLEQSYIHDRIYNPGDHVQYEGEAGPNLRKLSKDELKKDQEQQKPDDELIDEREEDLIEREKAAGKLEHDLEDKQVKLDQREKDLEKQLEALDERSKELDEREAKLNRVPVPVEPTPALPNTKPSK